MDTGPTGILIIVVTTTIRIGITGIGTGTDGQSATKPHKRGIAIWSFRCEFVLEQEILLRKQERNP
jgi:hypothetical protein